MPFMEVMFPPHRAFGERKKSCYQHTVHFVYRYLNKMYALLCHLKNMLMQTKDYTQPHNSGLGKAILMYIWLASIKNINVSFFDKKFLQNISRKILLVIVMHINISFKTCLDC